MMARLIEADTLHRKVKMETNPYGKPTIDYDSGVKVLEWIEQAPTVDAVPVVRCRDCKHWHKDTVFCGYMSYGEASERVIWYADDFCSYGERKDGDGNG